MLKGIATDTDVNLEKRNIIMKELSAKEAEIVAANILNEIIQSIRTPDR